jgi:ADP-heptose:LPS heptosyltransferase
VSRRALVVRLDSMGDVILAGPAVRAVAETPGIDAVWMLCGPEGAPAAALLPGVDRVITWSCPWIVNAPGAITDQHIDRLRAQLAEFRADEAVILTSFHQSPLPLALILRLAGIERISGVSVDYAGSLLDVRLRPGEDLDEELPEALRALAIVRAAGFTIGASEQERLRLVPTPDVSPLVLPGPYVVVHPGASAPSRRWPAPLAAAAVRALTEDGLRVIVTGSTAEQSLTAEVAGTDGLDLGGSLELPQLASVLAGASVVIAGNTGPAHLAAAVGTPVVSLFSPVVSATRWAPWGVPSVVLGDQDAACRNSRARECPIPGHPCLASIGIDSVVEACHLLLGDRSRVGAEATV